MRLFNYFVICSCVTFLAGCATPPKTTFAPPADYIPLNQVEIPSRFDTVEVTRDSLGIEVGKCVPQLGTDLSNLGDKLRSFPSNNAWGTGHASSGNIFLLRQTTAFCLHRSTGGFPIFAAETFFDTANPVGVPPEILDVWYKKIAFLIASKGSAKVVYEFSNGKAFVIRYWIEKPLGFGLFYSGDFRNSGAWETEDIDIRFSHPSMQLVSIVNRSGRTEKMYPLSHRYNKS